LARGHEVRVYEPREGWSRQNLRHEHGEEPIREFRATYPGLDSVMYDLPSLDLQAAVDGADAVLVHEWNDPALVNRLGNLRERHDFGLYFHDTHHRAISDPAAMARYHLENYDGVLAYGKVLRDLYLESGRARQAWIWHEAADTRVFHPIAGQPCSGDLVWIGNWGDDERTEELHEFLIEPVKALGLKARVYGVRYPVAAQRELLAADIEYGGWLANFKVPQVFAQYKLTVHIPRRPYVQALPGIPTIRVFEALACGIPMVCSPWSDTENLFNAGQDYLSVRNGKEMKRALALLLDNSEWSQKLAAHGWRTIQARHTCGHRVDELLDIVQNPRGNRVVRSTSMYENRT